MTWRIGRHSVGCVPPRFLLLKTAQMTEATINFDRLLRLRLIVARIGEMDLAKWWNTRGQLGRLGAAAVRRGFPRTHYFAQARSIFAVAAHRCSEIFDPPDSVTLWRLPDTIEEEFEARWERWLDQASEWQLFFQKLEDLQECDLKIALHAFDAVTNGESDSLSRLRRSAEGRAGIDQAPKEQVIRILASPHDVIASTRGGRFVGMIGVRRVERDIVRQLVARAPE
jgi:hypothetical protein